MSKSKNSENKEEFTGRYLVLMENGMSSMSNASSELAGLQLRNSKEFEDEIFTEDDLKNCDGIYLDNIGVAIVNKNPKADNVFASMSSDSGMIVEKERYVYPIQRLDDDTENYVRGYRDAVNAFADMLIEDEETTIDEAENQGIDVSAIGATWGLKATRVIPPNFLHTNPYSGLGIKVAILDTGFDFNHPDFGGRPIVSRSFVPGIATAQDIHGHGTHVTGTACGPKNPAGNFERYGIAYASRIYIGKVLGPNGGADGWILAGLNWACAQGCQIVNMSLGARNDVPGHSAIFENTARTLLNLGILIVAAAGNDSNRPNSIVAVSHPANCPSIMAVGAIDINKNLAYFTNRGKFPTAGSVDIVGPGVGVFSAISTPHHLNMGPVGPIRFNCSGTSMASPHVAGIAALWAQKTGLRGRPLWQKLLDTAVRLPQHPTSDVGAGLVQAPNNRIRLQPFPPRF